MVKLILSVDETWPMIKSQAFLHPTNLVGDLLDAHIFHDDCLKALRTMPDAAFDSLVTDPPAGIAFMGKEWDKDKGGRDGWVAWMTEVMTECLRVLKPGVHGLVWALPRTSHWTMTALENAGFEVRDVVTHLFGTGFPKSLDVSKAIDKAAGAERPVIGRKTGRAATPTRDIRGGGLIDDRPNTLDCSAITAPATPDAQQWQGFGTALKPACEFWILVRKPCSEKTVAANVLKHGTGGLNIDGCRIGAGGQLKWSQPRDMGYHRGSDEDGSVKTENGQGRFPANLVLDEDAAQALDEQSGVTKSGGTGGGGKTFHGVEYNRPKESKILPNEGGASRFFYVAKASKSDRGEGNTHPTVKSTALMRYLIKLVTPPSGTVLDPFAGSGSTGVAALQEGFGFMGIEQDISYVEIARQRMGA